MRGVAQPGVLDDELVRAVIGMKIVRQVAQVMHQGVRCALQRALLGRSPETRQRA